MTKPAPPVSRSRSRGTKPAGVRRQQQSRLRSRSCIINGGAVACDERGDPWIIILVSIPALAYKSGG